MVYDYQKSIGYRPNGFVCGSENCPDWDSINGCWRSFDTWLECDFDLYGEDDELEEWEEGFEVEDSSLIDKEHKT